MSKDTAIQKLFDAGAHVGFSRARRHPSMRSFIFDKKNRADIIDLEKTADCLEQAAHFLKTVAEGGKKVLFVSGKNETKRIVRAAAEKAGMPFVTGRWIGGTLTNFSEITKRVKRLEKLRDDKEKGNLDKYTKKERLLIDREIQELEDVFGGLVSMTERPAALFVVDPRHEAIAVAEAKKMHIPVVALAGSDCDVRAIQHAIPANDTTQKSVSHVVDEIVSGISAAQK